VAGQKVTLRDIKVEVELGFRSKTGYAEASAVSTATCRPCSASFASSAMPCHICPTDCITFTENGEESDLRQRLTAPSLHLDQSLYISDR